MAYKFLRGDTVRHIGKSDDLIVDQVTDAGTKYLLSPDPSSVIPGTYAFESELELVKRASDSETGLKLFYIT